MLYTTGYSDGQQQQLNDDDDDDESGALCIHSPSYGSTAIHHSSPPPPPPPPPQAFVSMDHPCRRPSKPSTDLVLPALDPKAQEVAAAIVPELQPPRRHFLRKKRQQVNLSTIRANYQSSRSHIREEYHSNVCGFLDDLYFHLSIYFSMLKSILFANQTIVLFVNLDLMIDLLMCIAYLVEMKQGYDTDLSPAWLFKRRSHGLWSFCQVLSLWNMCSYAIRFYISRYPLSVLFSFRGVIELLTSIPFLLSRLIPNGQYIYVPYFLRSWVFLLRIKSALKIKVTLRMTDKSMDALQYKQVYLIGNIVILLYNGMAAFQYSEAVFGHIHYDVLDSLFMVVVTLSTVGYGDITPSAASSRIVIMLLILITVAVIPSLISDLLDTMQKRDVTGGQIIKDADPFILIVGTFTVQQAKEMLDGFLNTDNVDERLSVVFLDTKPLTDELKLLGRNSVWGHRIHFLHSSVLDEKTLQRAQSRRAKAIFCISDSNAPDPVKEDERNTVRLWSMHCYTSRHNVPIYTYNLSPITAIYQEVAKEVICVRQFNQYLLALNCRCRGASTFLTNLLHQRDPLNQYDAPWEAQYDDGSCNEIYTAPAAACIVGISFSHAAWLLYKELQVILFAVRTLDNEIILNPAASGYTIQPSDVCVYIAQSSKEIRSIASLNTVYLWQMARMRDYSMASRHQQQIYQLAPSIDPSPPDTLPTTKPARISTPSKQRYQLSRLPSTTHSLLSGISVGGTFPIKLSQPHDPQAVKAEDQGDDEEDDIDLPLANKLPLMCHLLDRPANLKDITIHKASGMRGHILVCMQQEFINIFKFIYNLRSSHVQQHELQDIVILCSQLPSEKAFHPISLFPRVYIMEGNCRQPDDLLHAGIKRAKQVVVMSEKESADGQETDSAAIMTSHIIHLLLHSRRQDSYTIVNLVERSNIKFMHLLQGKQVDDEEIDVFYTPAYAAGDVVAESLISNVLLSQTYSKPEIVQVIRAMSGMPIIHHSHLASHLGYSSSSHKTEYTTRHQQHTSSTPKAPTCRFASMPVPDSFVGKTFVTLFEAWLLDHGILALGLFRAPTSAFGNELPFVYSNPVPSLMLLASDHVYVLVAQQQQP